MKRSYSGHSSAVSQVAPWVVVMVGFLPLYFLFEDFFFFVLGNTRQQLPL